MELIHYRHDDTTEQISEKTNKNLRQMSVQMNQKLGPIMTMLEEIRKSIDNITDQVSTINDTVGGLQDAVDGMQDEIDGISMSPPVNSYMLSDDDPQDYYTGTTWSYLETIVTDNDTSLDLYKRYQ